MFSQRNLLCGVLGLSVLKLMLLSMQLQHTHGSLFTGNQLRERRQLMDADQRKHLLQAALTSQSHVKRSMLTAGSGNLRGECIPFLCGRVGRGAVTL